MIAVALSPKARALIQAHRDALPTAADRERVAAALRVRLGEAVLPLEAPLKTPWLATGIQRGVTAACGLCIVGSALFLARRPDTAPQSTAQTHEAVAAAPSVSARLLPSRPSLPLETPATPGTPATPDHNGAPIAPPKARAKVGTTAVASAQDTLAQELVLLTSATSQLNSRQASGALLALEEHQRRFSHGVLSNERNVAKARALCMLHRFEEGRATLALLGGATPAAARVKEECDSAFARANPASVSHKTESD